MDAITLLFFISARSGRDFYHTIIFGPGLQHHMGIDTRNPDFS